MMAMVIAKIIDSIFSYFVTRYYLTALPLAALMSSALSNATLSQSYVYREDGSRGRQTEL